MSLMIGKEIVLPQFAAIQTKLLLLAVKESGRPTEPEIQEMIQGSALPRHDFQFQTYAFGFGELRSFYEDLCRRTGGPDPTSLPSDTLIGNALLAIAGREMQANGQVGVVCKLFPITSLPAKGLYLLEITGQAAEAVPKSPAKPWWKFWSAFRREKPQHLIETESVLGGFSVKAGPSVIEKYKDESPSVYSGFAFEVRPLDADTRLAELGFEVSCGTCGGSYAFSNELGSGGSGTREVHVHCPRCKRFRWIFRTHHFGTYRAPVWVFNVHCTDEKILRAANATIREVRRQS